MQNLSNWQSSDSQTSELVSKVILEKNLHQCTWESSWIYDQKTNPRSDAEHPFQAEVFVSYLSSHAKSINLGSSLLWPWQCCRLWTQQFSIFLLWVVVSAVLRAFLLQPWPLSHGTYCFQGSVLGLTPSGLRVVLWEED